MRRKTPVQAQKVAGKRRASGGGAGSSPRAKPRLAATGDSSKDTKAEAKGSDKPKLCFVCKSSNHIASACPERKAKKARKGGRVAAAQQEEAMDEDFA